jgi:hypothetical protein
MAGRAGSGTRSLIAATWSGLEPQVTIGASAAASISRDLSKTAPGSEGRVRQEASARSQSAPFGAHGRSFSQAKVVSSGATRPVRDPASMVMLQMVIRSAMDRASTVGPAYSMA